jgi:hypothetical protein
VCHRSKCLIFDVRQSRATEYESSRLIQKKLSAREIYQLEKTEIHQPEKKPNLRG